MSKSEMAVGVLKGASREGKKRKWMSESEGNTEIDLVYFRRKHEDWTFSALFQGGDEGWFAIRRYECDGCVRVCACVDRLI